MQAVVETPRYLADAERLFTADEREAIVDLVAADPRCGVVVPGGGSIRKVRDSADVGNAAVRGCSIFSVATTCQFFCLRHSPRTKGPI